jgi:hypothetical protein
VLPHLPETVELLAGGMASWFYGVQPVSRLNNTT